MPARLSSATAARRRLGEEARGSSVLSEVAVQRGDRHRHKHRPVAPQFLEQIEVARDQVVFGHDADRIAKLGQDFQAAAREFQPPLDRLVAIRHAAHGEGLRLPPPGRELRPEQLGRALFHQNARFEVQTGREPEVLVRGPGVAVGAAVFAAAVHVQAGVEGNVRAVVVGDQRLRIVPQKLGAGQRPAFLFRIQNEFEPLKAILRVGRSAAADGRSEVHRAMFF